MSLGSWDGVTRRCGTGYVAGNGVRYHRPPRPGGLSLADKDAALARLRAQVAQLPMEKEFTSTHRGVYGVQRLTHLLAVSRSGYYRWLAGEPDR